MQHHQRSLIQDVQVARGMFAQPCNAVGPFGTPASVGVSIAAGEVSNQADGVGPAAGILGASSSSSTARPAQPSVQIAGPAIAQPNVHSNNEYLGAIYFHQSWQLG